jgi:hypothetical protein
MNKCSGTYLLEPDSASVILIRRYARRLRLSFEDAVLLRAQLALELRQHQLGYVRAKKRPAAA